MKTNRWWFPVVLSLCVLVGIAGSKILGAKRTGIPVMAQAGGLPDTGSGATATATPSTAMQRGPAAGQPLPAEAPASAAPAPASAAAIATDTPAAMNPDFRLRPFALSVHRPLTNGPVRTV
jgi:hypothetical protein